MENIKKPEPENLPENHQKERQKKAKDAFNKKLVPQEGKCIFKIKMKNRLCYQ